MSVGVVNKQTGDRIPTAGMPAIDNALDLTSVNPVQNAIVTAALANKQDKTDNALQTTDKTVVGGINELKSGLTNVQDDVKLNTQDLTTPSRTKNLLPMTIERIKALNTSGTWRGNTYNINNGNIVFTVNSQGSITNILIDGQFNNNTLRVKLGSVTADKDLILNGYTGNWDSAGVTLYANEAETTTPEYSTGTSGFVTLVSGKVYEFFISFSLGSKNANLNPMVRYATITDPTFVPYIPSVDARLDAVESGLTNKANVAIYHMGGGQTVNIEHTNIVAIMSDRGGLYTDGIANRGINDLVPSTQITVTHVDAAHVTVTNNSQYGTSILVLSDGDITMTPVQ